MTTNSPTSNCVVAVLGLALGPGGVPPLGLRARCERAARLASERDDATLILTGGDAKGPSTYDVHKNLRFLTPFPLSVPGTGCLICRLGNRSVRVSDFSF